MEKALQEEKRGEEFERYRGLLFSIAYRMTGSASEAEDLVQETFLRYQTGAGPEIASLKAYLSTIVTRLALDYLKSARVSREQYVGVWLPEPVLTAGESGLPLAGLEQREEVSLAFLRLLETLSPPERAVFLLHEVFDYPFKEIGEMLEKSPANCRQIFHRARQALENSPARYRPEPRRQQQLLAGFLAASQAGDLAALTGLLAQDVVSWSDGGGKVQATLKPVLGPQAVARFWKFWLYTEARKRLPLVFTLEEINGSPAVLFWDKGKLAVVVSLRMSETAIEEIFAILNPEKLAFLEKQLAVSTDSGNAGA